MDGLVYRGIAFQDGPYKFRGLPGLIVNWKMLLNLTFLN